MSYHSEEIWESFDALGRRIQRLSQAVKDLEARLEALEATGGEPVDDGLGIRVANKLYERGAE